MPKQALSQSDRDLMRFAACANDYASLITDRWDLIVKAGAGLGHGAPACFIPSTAEIELDVIECCAADKTRLDRIGWALGSIDMARPKHRNLIPVTTGALIHECSHSIFTLWPEHYKKRFNTEPKQVIQLAMALEEGRHESRMARLERTAKPYLQRTLNALIIPSMATVPSDNPFALLHALALLYPRISGWGASVEWDAIYRGIDATRGPGTVQKLTETLTTQRLFAPVADTDDTVLRIARLWWELLPESAKDETPNGGAGAGEVCASHGESAPEPGGSGADAMGGAKETAKTMEDVAGKKGSSDDKAIAEARESEKSVGGKEATERAAKRKEKGGHGYSPGNGSSGVIGSRVPSAAEKATAKRLGAVIRSAQAVSKVKGPKATPPGNLRGRSAVQWSRDRAIGQSTSVDLFKGKVKGDDIPPVRIGIAMDVSGSMDASCDMAASLGWTIASAAWDAEALVSAVCFGTTLYPYVEVGKALSSVKTLGARDGHEAIHSAMAFLDSEIDLMHGEGPSILVIISDCAFTHEQEREAGAKWAKDFVKNGGHIIYVGRNDSRRHYHENYPVSPARGAHDVDGRLDTLASEIGAVIRKVYARL